MSQGGDIIAEIRKDSRVDVVVESFVAQRLGCTLDDLRPELLALVLEVPMIEGMYVIGAKRLLERLDAFAARQGRSS